MTHFGKTSFFAESSRLLLFCIAAFSGCQRSTAYKKDQSYYQQDPMSYYADRDRKSPTQRVEMMGQPKKRVAVFDFWNDTYVKNGEIGEFAGDELRRALMLSQRVIVTPDSKPFPKTEEFVDLGSGRKASIKVGQLIEQGKSIGVAGLIIGRITKIVFRQRGDEIGVLRQKQSLAAVDVELKLFDVAAKRELMATAKSGEASTNAIVATEPENLEGAEYRAELVQLAVREAVKLMVPDVAKAVEKMMWEGRIIQLGQNNKQIIINAGRESGLVIGDILKVLTPGEDIVDQTTNTYLGRSPGLLKGTLEVIDFLQNGGAITELHTGGNFQKDDLVRLY